MQPLDIIKKYYNTESRTYRILIQHGELVSNKAIIAAGKVAHLNPDLNFIKEAAMLHDIGIFFTRTPELGCTGEHPYISHGYLGRDILEREGFKKHALACERHIGVGIRADEIRQHRLPLPERDMLPVSIEEQIICYADKFFSKNGNLAAEEKSVEDILRNLEKYGKEKVNRFMTWVELFE
ncbi:HD domain-containing protein [Thermodesulfobacteriota bacterium]